MGLGLSDAELEKLYEDEFNSIRENLKPLQKTNEATLMGLGYSNIEANIEVALQIAMMAIPAVMISVVSANNLRIKAQLEAKNIEI